MTGIAKYGQLTIAPPSFFIPCIPGANSLVDVTTVTQIYIYHDLAANRGLYGLRHRGGALQIRA